MLRRQMVINFWPVSFNGHYNKAIYLDKKVSQLTPVLLPVMWSGFNDRFRNRMTLILYIRTYQLIRKEFNGNNMQRSVWSCDMKGHSYYLYPYYKSIVRHKCVCGWIYRFWYEIMCEPSHVHRAKPNVPIYVQIQTRALVQIRISFWQRKHIKFKSPCSDMKSTKLCCKLIIT